MKTIGKFNRDKESDTSHLQKIPYIFGIFKSLHKWPMRSVCWQRCGGSWTLVLKPMKCYLVQTFQAFVVLQSDPSPHHQVACLLFISQCLEVCPRIFTKGGSFQLLYQTGLIAQLLSLPAQPTLGRSTGGCRLFPFSHYWTCCAPGNTQALEMALYSHPAMCLITILLQSSLERFFLDFSVNCGTLYSINTPVCPSKLCPLISVWHNPLEI